MINDNNQINFALISLAKIKNKYGRNEIKNYFEDLSANNNPSVPGYKSKVLSLLASMHLNEDDYTKAANAYDKIIRENSESYEGINARFEKFFAAFHYKKDKEAASILLSEIQSLNIEDEELLMRKEIAEYLLNVDGNSSNALNKNSNNKVNSENEIPEKFALLGNYPNPFNPSTTIAYNLPSISDIELRIYDILGNEIRSFFILSQSAGKQNIIWNGRNNNNEQVSSGIYIYRFKAVSQEGKGEVFDKSAKLILMK